MGCVSSTATVPLDDIVISIFGIDNAGKTCFLRSLAGDFNFDSVPTIGLGQETFMYDDIQLTVYDLGGNSKFRSVWQRFYAEIWGYIYLVDASDSDRFQESMATLQEMQNHKMLKGKPFIVVANKQDLPGAKTAADIKQIFQLPKKIQVVDAVVTSVDLNEKKCNPGVSTAVSSLIADIIKNFKDISKQRSTDLAEQQRIEEQEKAEKKARLERARAQAGSQQEL